MIETMPTVILTSAMGILSMLNEPHPSLKHHALSNLNILVEQFWPEITASVPTIESLYEDKKFDHKELAALIVSKVYYCLGVLNESLSYALKAGSLFDVSEESHYGRTLLVKVLDEYATQKQLAAGSEKDAGIRRNMNRRLEAIVEKMLDKCIMDGKYQQAIGMAIECRRMDKLKEAIINSDDIDATLSYCINLSQAFVSPRKYRCEVLRLLVEVYQGLESPDNWNFCQCLMFLNDHFHVSSILAKLIRSKSIDDASLAYQIAFDLIDNDHRLFLSSVTNSLSSHSLRSAQRDEINANRLKKIETYCMGKLQGN